ncbi:MAG TPA: DUF6600 domain-containing protein [Blastococcus sp.]|jgi:hypothetical protein
MRTPFVRIRISLAAAAAVAIGVALPPLGARAQTYDGPGTGVARISLVRGEVAVRRGDSASATAAVVNAPLLGADYVTTGSGARAEIELDAVSAVRLAAGVQLRFARIDAGDRELQLAEGTIGVRLLRDGARVQIDTPSVAIRPRGAGSYRIAVDAGGRTAVTVRSGVADVVTPSGTQPLVAGATLYARGSASNPALERGEAVALDDFDAFNDERDARALRALADANAPPGVAGVADLVAYGAWANDATYGSVWFPTAVAPGWAPYRNGRWAWEEGFGWTWIGAEPWGWAPYHYGRWFHQPRRGWCWVPARAVVPWSPALVSFLTFGGGPGLGFDTIGWVPLAPFEPFLPWWNGGGTTLVTIDEFSYPHHRHGHASFANLQHGGATQLPKRRFLEGRFERAVALGPSVLRGGGVVRGPLPLVPSDANLRFSERPVAPAFGAFAARHEFAGTASVAHRMPIDEQRAALRATRPPPSLTTKITTTTTGVTVINGTTATSAPPVTTSPAGARGAANSDAWSRFDAATRARPVTHQPVTVHDLSAPAQTRVASPRAIGAPRSNDTPRSNDAPRSNDPPRTSAPQRSTDVPHAPPPVYAAPPRTYVPPPQQPPPQPAPQPVRANPPPARANPPAHAESHANGSYHHRV